MSKSKLLIYLSIFIIIVTIGFFYLKDSPAPDKVDLTMLDPNLYDQSWLISDSCEVACWHGIKPGVTSRENAMLAVGELSFVDNSKMTEAARSVSYPCKVPTDTTCVGMIFGNGDVEFLYLFPNYPITMEQAVEKLGDPDWYEASLMSGARNCILSLVWKEKQLALKYLESRSEISVWRRSLCEQIRYNNGKIPKGLIISDIAYMLPDVIEGMEKEVWKGFAESE